MNRYYLRFSPPLRSFLLQRGRDRKGISTDNRRDLRERSREQGGAIKVQAPVWLLFFGSAGSQGQGVKGESLAHDIFAAKLKVS